MPVLSSAVASQRPDQAALENGDETSTAEGRVVHFLRSKTHQEGAGWPVGIPIGSEVATCPLRSLKARFRAGDIGEGSDSRWVFRTANEASA